MNINNYRNRIRRKQKSVVGLWIACFVFLVSIGTGNQALGQLCTNPGGGSFSLSTNKTCINQRVDVINVPSNFTALSYAYDYKGEIVTALTGKLKPDAYNTFTNPGSYTVLQLGSGPATGISACQVVEVLPLDIISFKANACLSSVIKLSFDLTDNTKKYDRIRINWGDAQQEEVSTVGLSEITHTYAFPGGAPTIRVWGLYSGISGCISQEVRVTVPIPLTSTLKAPFIQTLTSTGNKVEMRVEGEVTDEIEIWQKNGTTYQNTGKKVGTGSTVSFDIVAGQASCFQLVVRDACNNERKSDEVCTIDLSAQAANNQNNLSWTAYSGTGTPFRWSLKRTDNGVPSNTKAIPNSTNKSAVTLVDDINITCNVQYCYTLEAEAGPTKITSSPVCVTGQSSTLPVAPNNLQVSVADNGQIEVRNVTTGLPTSFTMLVLRADSPAGPFQQVGSVSNSTVFKDPGADPNARSYCYQIVFQNNCGNVSTPSKPVCSVWLGSLSSGIDWTADSPFTPGTVSRYVLEIYDTGTNTLYKEIPLGGNTHYEPDPNDQSTQTFRYRIRAESATGESTSNYFELKRNASIFVPTAFTPNGDGQNDRFLVLGTFLDNFEMIIYSRWGDPIYQTTSLTEGWDGNIGGQQAPTGAYAYRINVRDKDGQQIVKRGTVTLLR